MKIIQTSSAASFLDSVTFLFLASYSFSFSKYAPSLELHTSFSSFGFALCLVKAFSGGADMVCLTFCLDFPRLAAEWACCTDFFEPAVTFTSDGSSLFSYNGWIKQFYEACLFFTFSTKITTETVQSFVSKFRV